MQAPIAYPDPLQMTPHAVQPARSGLIPGAARFQVSEPIQIISETPAAETPVKQIGRGKIKQDDLNDKLADVFERVQDVYLGATGLTNAANFMLDLSMDVVPSDSGSVFFSDISAHDLYFAAARGPKANDVMKFRVPMGIGIVGFSAMEGVSLAISDAHRDPRFYKKISESLGYETRSILCSPIQKEGRVYGAIELINRKGGDKYTSEQINVLNYIAHELATFMINTGAVTQ